MYALFRAVLDSLLGWLTGEVRNRGQATDAKDDRELQTKIGKRIEAHLRERRAATGERFGGLHSNGARERGLTDSDGSKGQG